MGSIIWLVIVGGILIWYAYIALVVGIRGFGNIRDMLERIKKRT